MKIKILSRNNSSNEAQLTFSGSSCHSCRRNPNVSNFASQWNAEYPSHHSVAQTSALFLRLLNNVTGSVNMSVFSNEEIDIADDIGFTLFNEIVETKELLDEKPLTVTDVLSQKSIFLESINQSVRIAGTLYNTLFRISQRFNNALLETEGIIEYFFKEQSSIENVHELRKQSCDLYLICLGYARAFDITKLRNSHHSKRNLSIVWN